MPKMKTDKGAAKRFKITGSGKIMRRRANRNHLFEHKSSRVTRRLAGEQELAPNDVREINGKPQLEESQSLAAARSLLVKASQWKPTLMVGPPPVNDEPRNGRVRSVSTKFAELCGELDVPYFDSWTALCDTGVWLRDIKEVDGTHPTAVGYGEWARLIGNWPAWRDWLP